MKIKLSVTLRVELEAGFMSKHHFQDFSKKTWQKDLFPTSWHELIQVAGTINRSVQKLSSLSSCYLGSVGHGMQDQSRM